MAFAATPPVICAPGSQVGLGAESDVHRMHAHPVSAMIFFPQQFRGVPPLRRDGGDERSEKNFRFCVLFCIPQEVLSILSLPTWCFYPPYAEKICGLGLLNILAIFRGVGVRAAAG